MCCRCSLRSDIRKLVAQDKITWEPLLSEQRKSLAIINYYEDNCPDIYNPNESDIDNDQMGDACDLCDYENIKHFLF